MHDRVTNMQQKERNKKINMCYILIIQFLIQSDSLFS